MSNGVNKVILVGNCGADPELRFTQSGTAILNLSVATSKSWKEKQTGEKKEETQWHRVVAYRKLAEIIGQYARKGSKVYVEGELKTRKWQGKDGGDNYTTEIVANDIQILDSRPQASNQPPKSNQQSGGQGFAPSNAGAPAQSGFDDELDDQIPF